MTSIYNHADKTSKEKINIYAIIPSNLFGIAASTRAVPRSTTAKTNITEKDTRAEPKL